jgi:hypothetical protein
VSSSVCLSVWTKCSSCHDHEESSSKFLVTNLFSEGAKLLEYVLETAKKDPSIIEVYLHVQVRMLLSFRLDDIRSSLRCSRKDICVFMNLIRMKTDGLNIGSAI